MKLSAYAAQHGILYRTAWERFRLGKIPGAYKDELGFIHVPDITPELQNKAAIYARVSSQSNRDNLTRQVERVSEWAALNGYEVVRVTKEVASAHSDTRPKLTSLLKKDDYGVLIVEHKDRLTRFGWNWFDLFLTQSGKRLVVINAAIEEESDLVQDMLAIIYSFTARLRGARRAKNARTALESILNEKAFDAQE